MIRTAILITALFFFAGTLLSHAAGQAENPSDSPGISASRELLDIYNADQQERQNFTGLSAEDMLTLKVRDRKRRARVTELMKSGALQSAEDYFHAAMVFQHGDSAEDYLTAHVLATAAGFKGHAGGRWLSAASLDRYLQFRQSPQIFYTQFSVDSRGNWVLLPFSRDIPEKVLREYGARTIEETEKFLEEKNRHEP